MSDFTAKGPLKRVQLIATVIRADGTREELGVIADTSKRFWFWGRWMSEWKIRRANRRLAKEASDGNIRS